MNRRPNPFGAVKLLALLVSVAGCGFTHEFSDETCDLDGGEVDMSHLRDLAGRWCAINGGGMRADVDRDGRIRRLALHGDGDVVYDEFTFGCEAGDLPLVLNDRTALGGTAGFLNTGGAWSTDVGQTWRLHDFRAEDRSAMLLYETGRQGFEDRYKWQLWILRTNEAFTKMDFAKASNDDVEGFLVGDLEGIGLDVGEDVISDRYVRCEGGELECRSARSRPGPRLEVADTGGGRHRQLGRCFMFTV